MNSKCWNSHSIFFLGCVLFFQLVFLHCNPSSTSTNSNPDSIGPLAEEVEGWLNQNGKMPQRKEALKVLTKLEAAANENNPSFQKSVLLRLIADGRVRLWQVDHVREDVDKAIEYYSLVAKIEKEPELKCEAERRQMIVEDEVSQSSINSKERLGKLLLNYSNQAKSCSSLIEKSLAKFILQETTSDKDQIQSPTLSIKGKVKPKLLSIEKFLSNNSARFVLYLSGQTTFRLKRFEKTKIARLEVDDLEKENLSDIASDTILFSSDRFSHENNISFVDFLMKKDIFFKIYYFQNPFRIIVDVKSAKSNIGENQHAKSVRRIVIDPGHGGNDAGAIGKDGLREKDVTLDIANRAGSLLARELQIEVMLTRDSDTYIPLEIRSARANAFGADLFLSIHCNASLNEHSKGIQSFYLDETRIHDDSLSSLLERENASRTKSSEPELLPYFIRRDNVSQSLHLAELLHRATQFSMKQKYGSLYDQGIKPAGFHVLVGADMPSVLFEVSFISNPLEESRLKQSDYRQKIADGIVNAVKAYKEGL